jgi:ATP-dependent DNA helicase RecQ
MGINKPDVRWIVHYHPPLTLSEYVQEIGRAGRDGQRSQVLMLVSEPTGWLDPHDRQQRQYFLEQLQQQQRNAQNLVAKLPQRGHIPTVVRSFPQAEMALSLLHSTQQLTWVDPMHYQIQSCAVRSTPALNTDPIQAMQGFVRTKGCRWQFILESFGFYQEAQGLVCGHCDRCCKSS